MSDLLPPEYRQSELLKKLQQQHSTPLLSSLVCLFSDLDDTYILKYWPPEDVIEKSSQKLSDVILSPDSSLYDPTITLRRFLLENNIPIIAVTGRDLHQMNELHRAFSEMPLQHAEIMDFDAIIGAVGTEIYVKSQHGEYQLDRNYSTLLDKTSFDREKIYALLEELIISIRDTYKIVSIDFSKRDKRGSVGELPILPHKLSIEFKCTTPISVEIERTIRKAFDTHGFESIKLLKSCPYTIDGTVHKFNFDIVPLTKSHAINYLKRLLNTYAIVAGDSGNDYDMLATAADSAVVVGNAKHELRDALKTLPPDHTRHIYFAPEKQTGPSAILDYLQNIKKGKIAV